MRSSSSRFLLIVAALTAFFSVRLPAQNTTSLAASNNLFALDLFHQAAPDSTQNAFFSPYSISTALAMTGFGAAGDTASQMAKALHYPNFAADPLLSNYTAFQKTLGQAQTNSGSQLNIANSLWPEINPEHQLLPAYLAVIQANFSAAIQPVDYKQYAASALVQINNWVSNQTNNKINSLLQPSDVSATTRLVLVNAIYFKGTWATPFRPQQTTKENFTRTDGTTTPVLLMSNEVNARLADITDGAAPCQILALNYAAPAANGQPARSSPTAPGLSFIALLPKTKDGLAALEKSLAGPQLDQLLARLPAGSTKVNVFLPRFKLDQRLGLVPSLQKLGVADAFVAGKADFSGINGTRDLFISAAIHQAFVAVDETGTEAAAATAVGISGASAPLNPPPTFRADHPFLFLIRENSTGAILFMGRLANPPVPPADEIQRLDAMATERSGINNGPRTSGTVAPQPITGNIPANPNVQIPTPPPTQ